MAIIWNDDKWASIEQVRVKACTPPQPPPVEAQAALEEVLLIEQPPIKQPEWCNMICRHRDEFVHAIVLVTGPLGVDAFRVLFAMQSPFVSGYLRLTPKPILVDPSLHRQGLFHVLAAQ